jgi:hypothetical protein
MRAASARGTALGYPEPVNPLIPTVMPGKMCAAARSAGITLDAKYAFWIRFSIFIPLSLQILTLYELRKID